VQNALSGQLPFPARRPLIVLALRLQRSLHGIRVIRSVNAAQLGSGSGAISAATVRDPLGLSSSQHASQPRCLRNNLNAFLLLLLLLIIWLVLAEKQSRTVNFQTTY